MKHKILLLSAFMALISACGAWAENTIIKKQLLLNEAEKTWGADYLTVNISENSFTYNAGTNDNGSDAWGNGAMGWTNVSDISSYTNLVLKLKEATTADIEIVVANGGFWGMDNNYQTYLKAGATEISLPIAEMTKNGSDAADGSALDLTAVDLIFIRTGWVHEQTIKIDEFYLEQVITDTDAKDYEEIDVTGGAAFESDPTIDGSVITYTNGGKWAYDVSNINTSLYKYLVIVPKKPYVDETGAVQFLYGLNDGTNDYSDWGLSYGFYQPRRANVINLTDKKTYADENETETNLDFSSSDINCDALKKVYIKIDGSSASFDVSAIYFTNESPVYDNRWNFWDANHIRETEEADKWITVCLPYASAVCGAQAYSVVGVDNQDNPAELYLQPVNGVLKAGVAYVFKTNSTKLNIEANNYMNGGGVFFTKAGANTLTAPETDVALVGTFTDETEVPDGMYILTDEGWKTNQSGVTNRVNANRAYLDLSKVGEVPADVAAKCVTIGIEGKTTGIANLSTAAADSDAIYNMNGVRVSNPQKGIYIKNGKKFIVK